MNEAEQGQDQARPPGQQDGLVGSGFSGIIRELGTLAPGAIIYEDALARMAGKCLVSIKRAIARGELPPPTRFLGRNAWTAGSIIRHIEKRLEQAAREAEKKKQEVDRLRP